MLKVIFFFTLSLAVLSCPFYVSSQEKKPFEFADIEGLLKSGVISNNEIRELIDKRGINFEVTEDAVKRLKRVGANKEVIETVKKASDDYLRRSFGELYVESIPSNARVSTDGQGYTERTPLHIKRLPPGIKKLVVNGVEGYGDYKGEVTIELSKITNVKVELVNLQKKSSPIPADDFVFIKGGCFKMGDGFGDGDSNEKPVHEVCVRDFYMGKHEITQGLWEKVMGNNPSRFKEGDNYPVESVSWYDVQEFLKKMSQLTGRQYRLPTEAEWEYACRNGGKGSRFPWGQNKPVCQKGANNGAKFNDNGQCDGTGTEPVGSYAPNELGIYDMSGNVLEGTQDDYESEAYKGHSRDNPVHLNGGPLRVERGGSWANEWSSQRCTKRDYYSATDRSSVIGFRIVITN